MRPTTLALVLFAAGCTAPDPGELFNAVSVTVYDDAEAAEDVFVQAVTQASDSAHLALPDAENTDLYDAVAGAWSSGLETELVLDADEAGDPGATALLDVGAPVQLVDDGLTYFEFVLNRDVFWTSEQTVMSHAFAVVDRQRIFTATTAGHLRSGPRIGLQLRGEELVEDLLTEHNQLFGGIDATSVTAFDAPAKSIADFRWRYGTGTTTDLELWLGPQERLTKRVVDAIYSARSAIWVMTDELANDGLARALQAKAETGFDVKVVVGPAFRTTSTRLADELLDNSPDVDKRQVTDVDQLPTLVLVDLPRDGEGYFPHARAMIITHPLVSSARLYRGQTVVTDQLIDGAMWVLSDRTPARTDLLDLVDLFDRTFDRGEAL
ncbi:MAG: hypothetical protein KTR31_06135 [Myxococcales bacterium]|nr:hypothetical protein [Myxococcales bacterium]